MGSIFQVNESNGNTTITGSLTMSSQQIHSVSDPTAAQDAATKNYVDTIAQGITWKASVQAATTAALPTNTYNNGASGVGATLTAVAPGVLTIDGYTVVLNDRVLIKNEVTAANNGIYFVSTLGTVSVAYVLTRTLDYDTPTEVVAGTATFVEQGTVNSDSGFVQTTTGTIVIGTTALSFTQFTGLGEVVAGTGLSKSGNTISLITPVTISSGGTNSTTALGNGKLIASSGGAIVESAITSSTTGSGNVVLAGSPTLTGTLTVPVIDITNTTNQLVLGITNTTTLSATAPSASRTYTIPDAGSAANFILDKGNYTLSGTWTNATLVTPALGTPSTLVLTNATGTPTSIGLANGTGLPLTTGVTGTLPIGNGGTGTATAPTQYGIIYAASTTSFASTTAGSTGQVLTSNGTSAPTFQTSSASGTVNSGTQYQLAYYATSTNAVSSNSNITTNASNQLFVGDGTVSTPTYSFTNIPTSGLYNDPPPTVSAPAADWNTTTHEVVIANPYQLTMINMPVQLTTTGTLPSGFSLATTYYLQTIDSTHFALSATVGGPFVAFTTQGTGTHTVTPTSTGNVGIANNGVNTIVFTGDNRLGIGGLPDQENLAEMLHIEKSTTPSVGAVDILVANTGTSAARILAQSNLGSSPTIASYLIAYGSADVPTLWSSGPSLTNAGQLIFQNSSKQVFSSTGGGVDTYFYNDNVSATWHFNRAAAGTEDFTITNGVVNVHSNKITNLANGTVAADAAAYGQLHYTQTPVQGTETTGTSTSSTSFVNGGASASITPTSTSSKIKITITVLGLTSASTADGIVGVSRSGTDLFTTASSPCLIANTSGQIAAPMTLTYIDSPASTSSLTYQIRIALRGTGSFMIGGQASTGSTTIIILEEVI